MTTKTANDSAQVDDSSGCNSVGRVSASQAAHVPREDTVSPANAEPPSTAETGDVPGSTTSDRPKTARLSRRDRAAMTLALELVRKPHTLYGHDGSWYALIEALDALALGSVYVQPWCLRPYVTRSWDFGADEIRLVRARLYLALRAVLRADAGDYGGTRLCSCASSMWGSAPWPHPKGIRRGERCSWCGQHGCDRITPLWELAPAHADRKEGTG